MKTSIAAGRLAIAAAVLAAASGCFLPGDPVGPSIGIRVDDGVLTVYVPLCPGEKVLGATLDDPSGDGKQLWSAKGPAHPTSKVVRLGGADWKQQTGSYKYDNQEVTMDIDATKRSYGGGVIEEPLLKDLPAGTYDLNGKRATPADIEAQSNCDSQSGG
ncbi:hypothetical protein GCM10009554_05530 [Kribbella koreensis]|uniref:Lipoprotein n=1 Tax=Kribbella koreensis TaxID=57909 RepID=A0ABP3ZSK8_9ACTN